MAVRCDTPGAPESLHATNEPTPDETYWQREFGHCTAEAAGLTLDGTPVSFMHAWLERCQDRHVTGDPVRCDRFHSDLLA